MGSLSQKDMSRKDKKYTNLYFLFSSRFSTQQYCMVIFNMSRAIFSSFWSFLGAHLGATIPFKTIKISYTNTAYTMSCDLRKRWSHCHGIMSWKDKKYTTLYFLFSCCFSTHQYSMVIFNMSKAIFSSSWSFLGAHLHWKPFCIEYDIFTFEFLRFMYTIWFLKASNLDFIN